MKVRGIALGTAAFGAAYLLERQLGTVLQDMRRYDKLRAMSGDPSLLRQSFAQLRDYLVRLARTPPSVKPSRDPTQADRPAATAAANRGNGGGSFFDAVFSDVTRYLAIRSM